MLATLHPGLKHTRHRIQVDIPADLELESYPGPLEQVIANLVDNSLTHGFVDRESGCIMIEAQTLESGQITLSYSDDGHGIAPDLQSRIFKPFFTTRLGQGGSGLGLYIVYNLVTSVLGGSISVDSQPSQGATFRLNLPLTAPIRLPLG